MLGPTCVTMMCRSADPGFSATRRSDCWKSTSSERRVERSCTTETREGEATRRSSDPVR
jgi:hypothetical protein